jgi:Putative peptidoglycan binding domain
MKRPFLVILCLAICAPVWAARHAAAAKKQSSGSKTSSTKSAHATAKRKRRRRSSRKFVPKQKAPTTDRIKEIQGALAQGGYYQGDPNGKWDSSSVAALEKFQSANGIEPTGKLDAPSLQKLGLGSDIAGVSAPRPIAPASQVPSGTLPSTAVGTTADAAAPSQAPPVKTDAAAASNGSKAQASATDAAQQPESKTSVPAAAAILPSAGSPPGTAPRQ